jgi:HSP20 family protein
MTELILWKNREMDRLRRDIESTFRSCCAGFGVPSSLLKFSERISLNLAETDDALVVTAKLPGMKPENMDISVTENSLTLKGEAKEETSEVDDAYYRIEKSSSSFSRTISLPRRVKVDEVEATYKDGILEINMPKRDTAELDRVRIQVT